MSPPTCQAPSVLASQLQDWFKQHWNRQPSTKQRLLLDELIGERPDLMDQLRPSEVREWVRAWHKRLIYSLGQELPRERVLCAFSCVEDTIYHLDKSELDEFVKWAAAQVSKTPREFVDEVAQRALSGTNVAGGKLQDACYDLIDVCATLLYFWQPGRSGLRPQMKDPGLRSQMEAYVQWRQSVRPEVVTTLLGGAASNMANALRGLGLPVAVHWPYHSPEVARLCPDCLQRMTFEGDRKVYTPAKMAGNLTHPKRRSIVFSYEPKSDLVLEPTPAVPPDRFQCRPQKTDRVIYRNPFFVKAGRGWTNILLDDETGARVRVEDPGGRVLSADGWPFFPLFGEWQVAGNDFSFKIAGDALMDAVADQFDYVLLSGLNYLSDQLLEVKDAAGQDVNASARQLIRRALRRQLERLACKGVRLHLEIGGINSLRLAEWTREVIEGIVKSAGINQEELEGITGDGVFKGSPFFLADRPGPNAPPESFTRRYERACHLAQAFNLDELYVHGTDADLILVRGVPRGAIWQELMADLLGKGLVVLALLARSVPAWEDIARGLSLELKPEGFLALVELATRIAQGRYPASPTDAAALLRDIVFTGYWFNRDPGAYADCQDFSIIVIPVMWPRLPAGLSTAGAGDAASAVLTVLGRK